MRLRAYVQLLRPANVTTALADILAGYAVAGLPGGRALAWLLGSTACLYAGGIVLNDVFDREIDRVERPERPIPSGRASASGAATMGAVLLVTGVALAAAVNRTALFVAAAIAGFVLLYDSWGKRSPIVGPLNMGLCRGLNLLLGVAAAPVALASAWPLAGIPLLYIAAVTALSRGEVHGGRREIAVGALISLSLVLIALAVLGLRAGSASRAAAALALAMALAWRVLPPLWRVYRSPDAAVIRAAIRRGVLSLVLVDASIGAAYAGATYAAVILITALIAGRLARLFPVT